jgi:hypothetical protein
VLNLHPRTSHVPKCIDLQIFITCMHKFMGSNSLHIKSLRLTILQVYVVLSLKLKGKMEFLSKGSASTLYSFGIKHPC